MQKVVMLLFMLITFQICHAQKTNSFAQIKKHTVTGKVVDAVNNKIVEYATISLKNLQGKAVNGGITDAKGIFVIDNIPAGYYTLTVDFIGYNPYKADSIFVKEDIKTVQLNNIALYPVDKILSDVTVTAKTPVIENRIDKIVYNTANDVTSQGGVALDVLKKVPQVTVDIDGNVELQGSSSIKFLINGKPSSVFGNNLADVLASIPASQIKSIEAITSPGAKYDAQGTGGIINIVLKDNKVKGMNASINGSIGSRFENGSVNLNVKNTHIGINAFFSGNAQLKSHTPSAYSRITGDSIKLNQNGYNDFTRNGFQSGIGFDWDINKTNNLSGTVGYNHFGNKGNSFTSQEQYTATNGVVSDVFSNRNSFSQSLTNALEWSLSYRKKFKKDGEELSLQYDDSYGMPTANYFQSQAYAGQFVFFNGSKSNNPGIDREAEIALDYTLPVTDGFEIETGIKTTFNFINGNADVYTLNPYSQDYFLDSTQSYHMKYNRHIYAGYISGSFSVAKFLDVKAGLRYERTQTNINYQGIDIPPYNTLAPSIVISHSFQNKNSIKLAYSHRIERPEYREINPFYNLSDPYNITTGNPNLQPELGDNFELGFNKIFKNGGSLYISLVSRFNSHDIKPYTTFYADYPIGDTVYHNVSVNTRVNVGTENRTGISISGSVPVTKALNIRTNIFVSNRHIVNYLSADAVTNGMDSRFNVNLTYEFNKNFVAESFVNYNTAFNNVQGKQPQFFTYSFAMRKFFMNKKASIGITTTNIFNRYIRQETTVINSGVLSDNIRFVPYQSFGISFSYKFGKLEFKKSKEEDTNFLKNPDGN